MLQAEEARKTVRTDVTFVSNGLTPAGHLHTPDARVGHPLAAIVVIRPWGGVKEQTAGLHARRLTEHGFTVLAFDTAHQGTSEGEPRFLENPVQRAEDIQDAVSYLSAQKDVGPDCIGALGISTGGGHALYAAIGDQRIRAVGTVSAACIGSLLRDGFGGGQGPAVFRDPLARAGLLRTDEARGEPTLLEHIVPEEVDATTPDHLRQRYEYYRRAARSAHLRSENAWMLRSVHQTPSTAPRQHRKPRSAPAADGRGQRGRHGPLQAKDRRTGRGNRRSCSGSTALPLRPLRQGRRRFPALAKLTSFFGEHPSPPPVEGRAA
ncbi:alpha/beta hydrolase [Streptomyces sp. NBC_01314]|uniref:alpha/beta hydrolase n=1 Tax=Streptomyces sp. NBC_01314 TaxID=2903821 RepID=UPI0030929635|nr:dienelactone hydrolase family protein [Streptomyces sp. NBC_01314]